VSHRRHTEQRERPARTPRPVRGITLLETLLAAFTVAVAVTAISSSMMNSMLSTRQSGESIAVQMAARQKLEEITAMRFEDIYDAYCSGGTVGNTFDVYMTSNNGGTKVKLSGLSNAAGTPQPAGEVIIVTTENAKPSDYGRDISPYNGKPDGCQFSGLPMDLNGNGSSDDGNVWGSSPGQRTAIRFPVGVVIRWPGVRGEERYELWTIVSRY
jgi:Tfp pilus assembly protein PilV